MELKIQEEKVGREYSEELDKIIQIRAERRIIYGDSFLNESVDNILAVINGKMSRFNFLLKNRGPITENKLIDEGRDIVNYYIFLLCILQKGDKNA